jgi:hypothetical protein
MASNDFLNSKISDLIKKMDSLVEELESDNTQPKDNLIIPEPNLSKFESINDPNFETGEWDMASRSIVPVRVGFSGSLLKVKNVKLEGNIGNGSVVLAKDTVICQNCFGRIEAQNIMTENIGTFNNKLIEKNKMDIMANNNLVVHGSSCFAHIDAWNAEFNGFVRNSQILIGRSAIFNDVGNGTEIEINPLKSSHFSNIFARQQEFKKKFEEIKGDKESAYSEIMILKHKIKKTSHLETDNMPPHLKTKIEGIKRTYNNLNNDYTEMERFFIGSLFESKCEKIESLIKNLKKDIFNKCVIYIKGKIDPVVSISFNNRAIYLVDKQESVKIHIEDDKIVTEEL